MSELFLKLVKYTSIFLLFAYFYGFIAWNYLLGKFGFFEYNLLQTRYLSAGILYLFIIFILPLFLALLFKPLIKRIKEGKDISIKTVVIGLLILLFLDTFLFAPYIFPRVPQYLGGAQPFIISLIGNDEQINFLRNFNINYANEENKTPYQTSLLCSIYENQDFIILGAIDENGRARVLTLEWSQFSGVSVIRPSEVKNFKKDCTSLVSNY